MQNGIYQVHFSSSLGAAGSGLAVVKDCSIKGGDDGYLYLGHLTGDDGALSGRLDIKRYNKARVSIFGPLHDFGLALSGSASPDGSFRVSGAMAGQPALTINIAGLLLAPAA